MFLRISKSLEISNYYKFLQEIKKIPRWKKIFYNPANSTENILCYYKDIKKLFEQMYLFLFLFFFQFKVQEICLYIN